MSNVESPETTATESLYALIEREAGTTVTVPAEEFVFREGDPSDAVFVIGSGRVSLQRRTRLGDIVSLAVLGDGEAFGMIALAESGSARSTSAWTLEPCEMTVVHLQAFEELRRRRPTVDRWLINLLASQVRRLESEIVDALHEDAHTRVARRVYQLGQRYEGDGGVIPLGQEVIGQLAGVRPRRTGEILREYANQGLIDLQRLRIRVADWSGLRRRAHLDS